MSIIIQLIANQDGELCYALDNVGRLLTRVTKDLGFGAKKYVFEEIPNAEEMHLNPAVLLGTKLSHKGCITAYENTSWANQIISLAKSLGKCTYDAVLDEVTVTDKFATARLRHSKGCLHVTVEQYTASFRLFLTNKSLQVMEQVDEQ